MPRLSFLLFAFNFLIFVSSSAQERPTVTKDSNGHINVAFPTVPGRLYNLEAAPDGINFSPVPGKWLYGSLASPTVSLSLAQGPDFSLFFDPQTYNPLPAAPTQHAFLRLFLGETNTTTGLTQVSYALYFLNEPGPGGLDTQLYEYAFYSAHSYLYEIFQEDKQPPGSPQGSGIPYGPLLAGSVQLALPSASLLNDRLNGGTIPLTKIVPNAPSHITWHLQLQVHPSSAMTMLEQELGWNSSVTPNTDAHTKTAALLTQTDLAQTLLGNLANTTPGTPPEITPPAPGSLEGARLRIATHPAHLLHAQIPDDWFYANGYAQAFINPSLFNPEGDDDGDGISNIRSYELGLVRGPTLNNLDSDSDGLSDVNEAILGTSPFAKDSDGDGFSDLQELRQSKDPLSKSSNPLKFIFNRRHIYSRISQSAHLYEGNWFITTYPSEKITIGHVEGEPSLSFTSVNSISNSLPAYGSSPNIQESNIWNSLDTTAHASIIYTNTPPSSEGYNGPLIDTESTDYTDSRIWLSTNEEPDEKVNSLLLVKKVVLDSELNTVVSNSQKVIPFSVEMNSSNSIPLVPRCFQWPNSPKAVLSPA